MRGRGGRRCTRQRAGGRASAGMCAGATPCLCASGGDVAQRRHSGAGTSAGGTGNVASGGSFGAGAGIRTCARARSGRGGRGARERKQKREKGKRKRKEMKRKRKKKPHCLPLRSPLSLSPSFCPRHCAARRAMPPAASRSRRHDSVRTAPEAAQRAQEKRSVERQWCERRLFRRLPSAGATRRHTYRRAMVSHTRGVGLQALLLPLKESATAGGKCSVGRRRPSFGLRAAAFCNANHADIASAAGGRGCRARAAHSRPPASHKARSSPLLRSAVRAREGAGRVHWGVEGETFGAHFATANAARFAFVALSFAFLPPTPPPTALPLPHGRGA